MKLELKPVSVIIEKLGIQPNGPAHKFFTDRCDYYMDTYVPYRPKNNRDHLRDSKEKGVNYILYKMPYAHYQYMGQREDGSHKVQNYTTPGTGSHWDTLMTNVEKQNIRDEVQEYVRTHGGK